MTEEDNEQLSEDEEDESINLLDYICVLVKYKNFIFLFTLTVALISFLFTLKTYPFYQSQTSIYVSQEKKMSAAQQLMGQFGLSSGMAGGGDLYNNRKLFVEIIKSRTFAIKMIDRFNLRGVYAADDVEHARSVLFKHVKIKPDFTDPDQFRASRSGQSPLMRIIVKDQNSKRAAEIANAIVEELNIYINNIAISQVSMRRLFLEKQLKLISDALIESEEEVKLFQEKTGLFKVEIQTSQVINKIANLQAQITAQEIKLQVMKSYTTANNPDFQQIEETIKALKNELAKLELSESKNKDLIRADSIPALGLQYNRIFRRYKFNETLYGITLKQYEAAKLDEARDATIIQVIDKAVPLEKPKTVRIFGRKKALIVTILFFIFSCLLALAMDFYERSSMNNQYIEKIISHTKNFPFQKKI